MSFKEAVKNVQGKGKYDEDEAAAIVANASRNASPAAKKANPKLAKVKGKPAPKGKGKPVQKGKGKPVPKGKPAPKGKGKPAPKKRPSFGQSQGFGNPFA